MHKCFANHSRSSNVTSGGNELAYIHSHVSFAGRAFWHSMIHFTDLTISTSRNKTYEMSLNVTVSISHPRCRCECHRGYKIPFDATVHTTDRHCVGHGGRGAFWEFYTLYMRIA
jgi:hypothetical protein